MITRRTVLKAVTAGAVTAFAGTIPGIRAFAAATALRVRRSVNTMALDDPDLATYRDFVGIMRAKPDTDPVSWVGFANQHGTATDFVFCPHGDWYFLPWHRGFVDMYERAAAALTKNPKFAMPYWDWNTLRQLPAAFTDPLYKGKANPLYVPGVGDAPSVVRNVLVGPNALTDAMVGPAVMTKVYKETVYERFGTSRSVDSSVTPPAVQTNDDAKWVPMGGGFQGTLESRPHNNVHNNIGGYMPQTNSPRDPIFMMHHSNIDRIWAYWNALGRKNSTDPLWLNMPFTNNYLAPTGTPYTKKVKDLLSTTALGYTYDNLPKAAPRILDPGRSANLVALLHLAPTPKVKRFKADTTETASVSAPFSTSVQLESAALKTTIEAAPETKQPSEVVALISQLQIGDNVRAVRVFVNLDAANLDVPETDPHFVTTLSFLHHSGGGDGAHAHHKSLPSTIVDLTETLQNLSKANGLSGDHVTVQLVPVPAPGVPAGAVGKVVPASIEIAFI